jgi:hypothetical protein
MSAVYSNDLVDMYAALRSQNADGTAVIQQAPPGVKAVAAGLGFGMLVIDNAGRLTQRTNPLYLPWDLQVIVADALVSAASSQCFS